MERAMHIVDTHCHLDWESYDLDREDMMTRAREAGVGHMISIAVDLPSARRALDIARRVPGVYATVGVHPNDVKSNTVEEVAEFEKMLPNPKIVAVGETGLDFYRDNTKPKEQEESFQLHLELADRHDLPLVVHCRDAYDRMIEILRQNKRSRTRGVMHCYAGTAEQAKAFYKMGFYIAFGGVVTFKNASAAREVVKSVPTEYMLVETDAPFLAPHPHRGKRNEPAFITETVKTIAEVKGVLPEDIARATTRNASDLFGLNIMGKERTITYRIRDALYVNLTNRCTAHCVFCPIYDAPYVKGHYLGMKQENEPSAEEVCREIGDPKQYNEIVFCGYGEPTLKLDELKAVANYVKEKGGKTRLNTNGHGNLIHGRNILPELAGVLDAVSVSIDAPNAEEYLKIVRPQFGIKTFDAVKDFILESKKHISEVTASIVGIPHLNVDECREISEALGANFRLRPYNELG